jgi:hypothetical protein
MTMNADGTRVLNLKRYRHLAFVPLPLSGPGCVYLHAICAIYIVHMVRATAGGFNNDCGHSGYLCVRSFTFFAA